MGHRRIGATVVRFAGVSVRVLISSGSSTIPATGSYSVGKSARSLVGSYTY